MFQPTSPFRSHGAKNQSPVKAPGESGVPGPDLSRARRHNHRSHHRSHGFGLGACQQTISRQRRADNLGETPDGALVTGCCSPGDEPILTTNGWVAIKDLDPARDKLAGHHRTINRMTWGGTSNPATDGFMFERSAGPYRGNLIVLDTEQGRTRVTPNHRVPGPVEPRLPGEVVRLPDAQGELVADRGMRDRAPTLPARRGGRAVANGTRRSRLDSERSRHPGACADRRSDLAGTGMACRGSRSGARKPVRFPTGNWPTFTKKYPLMF